MENSDIRKSILDTLEGIQKTPRMYVGNGGTLTLEVLVFVLLCLLEDHRIVRSVFEKETAKVAGHPTSRVLSSYFSSEEEMLPILKKIQNIVLNK